MLNAHLSIRYPENETVLSYAPGSPERKELAAALAKLASEETDVPCIIGGREVRTGNTEEIRSPHKLKQRLGICHMAGREETLAAINAAMAAKASWEALHWRERATVLLKAAELLATKYRHQLNAATMLAMSKTCHQAEIDSACELIDFWRFNAWFLNEVYAEQPLSTRDMMNFMDHRPLEGFVFAVTPFNFTAIAGNLPTAPALMGNTVVWKPATTGALPAYFIHKILEEAGLPPGVINMINGPGPEIGDIALAHRDLGGVHFTGSTRVFAHIWKTIGNDVTRYKSYPRIVGETGGKDFILAHPSAPADALAAAIIRGGFEFQGQKCSAASRVYIPESLWPAVKQRLQRDVATIHVGDVADFSNFMGAVIDRHAFDKITSYITHARETPGHEIITGGTFDDSEGYFIQPTIVRVEDPHARLMEEEIFGPVVAVYVYKDDKFEETMKLVDSTSPYALTGAIFAQDRAVISRALEALRHAAGNFYINDKPTGAVVGQQPFGGARASGTNDKAGSKANLLRWVSPRSIKETYVPATDYRYPFLAKGE